jgi:hypothetical protein
MRPLRVEQCGAHNLRYRGKMKLWVLNTIAEEATGVTVARHNLSFTEMFCSSAANADNLG